MLLRMTEIDIKKLRQRVFSTLTEDEQEEAGGVLRAYLAVCARIYEKSAFKELVDKSPDDDSTSCDSRV